MQSPMDTQGLSMGKDVAGLIDDDNPALEEVDATAGEDIKNVEQKTVHPDSGDDRLRAAG